MPARRSTPTGYLHARALRKQLTPAESRLWAYLRSGRYVADFCSPRHHLVIELDGSPHLDQEAQDLERTQYLRAQGYSVVRFWNNDVMTNMDRVVAAILDALQLG